MPRMIHTEAWEYLKTIEDKSFDAILTDPMYDSALDVAELRRVTKGNIIVFCDPKNQFFKPDEYAFWIKQPAPKNYSNHLGRYVEMILIQRAGSVFNSGLEWPNYIGVYADSLLKKRDHPFEKPESLLRRLIEIYTKPGDVILDPFSGSGSTLRAASATGRRAIGCEIQEKYCVAFWESEYGNR